MSISLVTERFLDCLNLLVDEGKVRSKRHFAITLGYHAQGISEMTASRRDAPLDLIEKAILTFQFNPYYLFTGQGRPFTNAKDDDGLRLKNLTIVTDDKGDERIVHVPYPAQAGYGKSHDDPVFIQELPTYKLPDPQFRSGTYRSFEIAGTSMEPTFKPSDIVIAAFVEPRYWEQAIKTGQIYIVVTSQDVVIKRLINRIKSEKLLECVSDNKEFESYAIAADEIREVWKPRVKITSHTDLPPTSSHSQLSEQLQVQNKILENLQHHLTNLKVMS